MINANVLSLSTLVFSPHNSPPANFSTWPLHSVCSNKPQSETKQGAPGSLPRLPKLVSIALQPHGGVTRDTCQLAPRQGASP
eukprot:scaffold7792_cov19-Tisochrysis_lutea.AAC.1